MFKIMFDYFRVLERYGFEPEPYEDSFRSPGGRVSATFERNNGLLVHGLDENRAVLWSTMINCAPAEVLDAIIRIAEPELSTRVHSGPGEVRRP